MLAPQRQALILDEIRMAGAARVVDLAMSLAVSEATVRRDLEVLHERGLVEKVHGGATMSRAGASYEPAAVTKASMRQAEKEAIAARAATLIEPGTAIGISAGTTTRTLARHLSTIDGLTVVTNSVAVAEAFDRPRRHDQTIILAGGTRTPSDALVGPFALAALRSVHLDLVVMGVHGMDLHAGFTTPNLLEAETDRALVATARRLIVVADHTKYGVVGISSYAALGAADTLVTDDGLPEEARAALAEVIREVIVVSVPGRVA
jgi:DeoR/GlpR family transcriptional regulator of sugar metabolism